jgi:hypothetical protein
MFTFIFSKIPSISQALSKHFAELKPDSLSYINTNFISRFRSFGEYRFNGDTFDHTKVNDPRFNPKLAVHTKHSNSNINEISDSLIRDKEIPNLLKLLSVYLPINVNDYLIGVNLVRVIADQNNFGNPAPSLHQDSYEYSLHLNIGRQNVSGGTSLLSYSNRPEDLFMEKDLEKGDFLFFNDKEIFHTASPIGCKIGGYETYRDMIIIDFIKKEINN